MIASLFEMPLSILCLEQYKVYAQLIGLTSLANLSPADQSTITSTVIIQLNIVTQGATASLLESGNAVYVAVTCPASLSPAYIVAQFTALKPTVLYSLFKEHPWADCNW